MRPQEYEAWTAFKDGLWRVPEFDWDNRICNQLPPSTSLRSLKVAHRQAEALNRLYKTNRAHEGHVTRITQKKRVPERYCTLVANTKSRSLDKPV